MPFTVTTPLSETCLYTYRSPDDPPRRATDNNDSNWINKQSTVFYGCVLKWAADPDGIFDYHPRSQLSICLERAFDACCLDRQGTAIWDTAYVCVCWLCSHARYRVVVDFQKRWHHRFSDDPLGGGGKHRDSWSYTGFDCRFKGVVHLIQRRLSRMLFQSSLTVCLLCNTKRDVITASVLLHFVS